MVKKLLTLIACFAVMLTAFTAEFRLSAPFTVDDFEEGPSNIIATAYSSNIVLVPSTNLTITGTGSYRLLSVLPESGVTGESQIRVELKDLGYSIRRSPEMSVTPGILSSNIWTNNVLFSVTNKTTAGQAKVDFTWNDVYDKLANAPYLIHRSIIPLNQNPYDNIADIFRTIGSTFGNSFTDTNVFVGTNYYYFVTFAVAGPGIDVQTTNYQFTLKVPPEVKLAFLGDGWGFEGKAGKTYRIMTKNDMNENWQKILDVNATTDQLFIFRGQEYLDKPVQVREID